MVITYNGGGYFKIQSGSLTLLIDPENQRSFKGADLVLNTDLREPDGAGEGPLIVSHAGEYEAKGIRVIGRTENKASVYRVQFDEIILGIIGPIANEPKADTLALLKDVDVMIIPAGGKPALSEKESAALVKKTKPGIVIPSFFKNIKPFLKELGEGKSDEIDKLTIKKKDIEPKKMKVVVLKS